MTATLVVMVVLATLALGYILTELTTAQSGSDAEAGLTSSIPFGGQIESVDWCTCSFGFRISVGDPVPAENIVVQLGVTEIFMWWQVYRTGPWTLGLWSPGGVCEVYAGKSCYELDVEGTVLIIGTSM